jgi:cell division protease FtsH
MAQTRPDTPPDPDNAPRPSWLPPGAGRPGPRFHFNFWYIVLALLVASAVQDYLRRVDQVETIPYSRFREAVAAGEVERLEVGAEYIRGIYRQRRADGGEKRFNTVRVDLPLADELAPHAVQFAGEPGPGLFARLLSWLAPLLLFFVLWSLVFRRSLQAGGPGGSMLAIGKSNARVYMEKDVGVSFDDVAGVDEAKEELKEVIQFLRDPRGYGRLGAHVPKGVLLVGPPGTGKTLLARAVAGEAGVPFFSISGSEFVELFVGVGAARVRDLFDQARAHAPCIIFIDELDALGRSRLAYVPGGGHDEKEQTLNQLLNELDGFDPSSGVVLLAATNRPEILDPALLRAGRFDRQILVDRPEKSGRRAILDVHLAKLVLAKDVDADELAAMTIGFTGADLATLANEGALLATRRGADAVAMADLEEAIERIVAGLQKRSRILTAHERQLVAYHEAGHALVAMALPGTDPIQKISIIPRGIAGLGMTLQRPTEDRFLMDRTELGNRMAVLMGGRAAEMLRFGELSTGAADDLGEATAIARSMVTRFGMSPELGVVSYEDDAASMLDGVADAWTPRAYADTTASRIDQAVKEFMDQALATALAALRARRGALDAIAAKLLVDETLSGEALAALAAASPPADAPGAPGAAGAA